MSKMEELRQHLETLNRGMLPHHPQQQQSAAPLANPLAGSDTPQQQSAASMVTPLAGSDTAPVSVPVRALRRRPPVAPPLTALLGNLQGLQAELRHHLLPLLVRVPLPLVEGGRAPLPGWMMPRLWRRGPGMWA